MAIHQTIAIAGPDDRELGVPRTQPLRYHLTTPAGKARGLVYLIPGFGEDNDRGYATHLREALADRYGLAVASVEYHACRCRVDDGARIDFRPDDARLFASYVTALGVAVDDSLQVTLEAMQRVLERLPEKREVVLTADIVPRSGEHQNFGVVQALDHLTVHADLLRRSVFDRRLVIAFGSSHGAYIGHLMARMAPNTVTAVFDNSGYARPALPYFVGRELRAAPVVMRATPLISLIGYPYTRWTLEPGLPNSYGGDAHRFRDLLDARHLAAHVAQGGARTRFRCIHSSADDRVAPISEKRELDLALRRHGFDADLLVIGPADVDGHYVKTLEHGLGLSLKTMFERMIGTVEPATWDDDFARGSLIDYPGDEGVYRFRFSPAAVEFTCDRFTVAARAT